MWDIEVDVACIGAGIGALAGAIGAVDAGGEVLVAAAAPANFEGAAAPGSLRERVRTKRGWLVQNTLDVETDEAFAAVAEGVAEWADVGGQTSIPMRVARNLSREEARGRVVEPFVGSRLTDWASQCLASPSRLMYTSMRDWRTTTMRSSGGDSIEVFSIGAMTSSDGFGERAIRQWLSEQASQRDIEIQPASTFERLMFEDGVIVGVVLSTPEGPYAVRTRCGVTFAPWDQDADIDATSDATSGDRLQVCLVGRTASRFCRVELLATEPAAPARPTCTGTGQQYREGMREYRQLSPEGWRCGRVQAYPPQ